MSTTYTSEVENIGGSHGMLGGGSVGVVILLILLFIVFCGSGLLGGGRAHASDCGGVTNCAIDKDVVTSKYDNMLFTQNAMFKNEGVTVANADRVIANTTARYALEDERAFNAMSSKINALETRLYEDARFNQIEKTQAAIMCELGKKPSAIPTYAESVTPCVHRIHTDSECR